MELFTSLGINSTVFVQMGVFLVGFLALKYVLFDAYYAAFEKRSERTVGQVDEAEKYLVKSKELETQYANEARKINEEYKTVYDQARAEATKEYDRILEGTRNEVRSQVEANRSRIREHAQAATKQVAQEIPQLSALISSKLVGKELH